MDKKALDHFKSGLNCAQAVWKTFRDDDADGIGALRACGGGRAEGGLCGALYAARELVGDEAFKNEMDATFREKAGAVRCREVRAEKRLTCGECVALAARIVSSKNSGAGDA